MTNHLRRGTFAAVLIAALVAGTGASTPVPYQTEVVRAVDTCQPYARTYAGLVACVGGLAAPDPGVRHQVDLWHTFLDCLSAWYKSLDNMYPGGADVNACLEAHGWDVGP